MTYQYYLESLSIKAIFAATTNANADAEPGKIKNLQVGSLVEI